MSDRLGRPHDARLLSLALLTIAVVAGAFCACDDGRNSATTATIVVFAASSLTGPFEELARTFESSHPLSKVELHCAGTPQLVLQIESGAEVDVFAAADEMNMKRVTAGSHSRGESRVFAKNRLIVVVEKGNPESIRGIEDLARRNLRVLLCGPEVPAGHYAREVLAKAGVRVTSASDEPNVKAVVAKLMLGEADAGLVYVTDHAIVRDRLDALEIADEFQVEASYPIVAISTGRNAAHAARFIEFVTGPVGRATLERFGFASP